MSPTAAAAGESISESAHLPSLPPLPPLRSVTWRIHLGILPSSSSSSSIDRLRRAAADSRRRYASLRRRLLTDAQPALAKDEHSTSDLSIDNPLSQNPESTWGRFFRNAELEKTVDQDLTRLYPEDGSYFQTPTCQAVLRRILLLWSLQHPQYGYRQGMHELLAPLVYVLHVDLDHLSQVRKLHKDYFTDGFDESLLPYNTKQNTKARSNNDEAGSTSKLTTFADLDPEAKQLFLLSDPYGAEGELGVVLSERFMEHDAYCMFDRLMDGGSHSGVSMAEYFSHSNPIGSGKGTLPVIEASSALYHLLNFTDPSLHSHLVELGVEPQYFALRWLRVLFGREFNLEELLTIWDEVFEYPNDTCLDLKATNNGFQIFCSDRGAFIASFGVSMILHLRPALLATENVTVCLQKLLNFPKNVDIKRLIEKARSLHGIALEANESIYGSQNSSGSGSNRTPPHHPIPDSYWEERWRVLHKTESLPSESKKDLVHGRPVKKRSFREKLGLVRTESDPSAGENNQTGNTVRRQLFAVSPSCEIEKCGRLNQSVSFSGEPSRFPNQNEFISREVSASNSVTHDILNGSASGSVQGEDSSASSVNNDRENYENDTDKSSVTSNSFIGENAEQEVAFTNGKDGEEGAKDEEENTQLGLKETRSVSGKFGWLFKFGRGSNGEVNNNVEKGGGGNRITDKDGSVFNSNAVYNSNSNSVSHIARAENSGDKKVMGTFKNLGQSMLENIQVIESVFQQDRGKGQATAMAALTELRKISNLLREM
ncbi:hypothetical protein LUZ61_008308 [Rhynchospora tenuis]|uniref:Rab-GAP TBC domain-containing protein n=1 Tax=Rhynchospora tenuis TaxID=198213 RepID=A0AAD5ZVD0_9POAL|nr:hypothetical protein LUZ61_008308 [Rhynchospora tenuis]